MRVLHLAPRLSERGGADRHTLAMLDGLGADHRQHLAVGRDDRSTSSPCLLSVIDGLDARGAQPVALDSLVHDFHPDVIHLHNLVNPWVLEWAATQPSLLTVQDHRFFCPGRGKWTLAGAVCTSPMSDATCAACFDERAYFSSILQLTRRRLAAIRQLTAISVLSGYMRDELTALGVPAAKIHVVPPPVHGLDLHATPDGPDCALFVGRLVAAKGVREAIAAWQLSGIRAPLVVAGTGALRAELERKAIPDVELLGWVPHQHLAPIYRRARVLLLPSRWQEPFGIVGLEALAMGVPVAAWDSGGVCDWHPGNGLIPWGDTEELARSAASLWGDSAAMPSGFGAVELTTRLVQVYQHVAH